MESELALPPTPTRCKSLQSKKAEIKGQGELQGALENPGDASINAASFQVYAWDQRCVIV